MKSTGFWASLWMMVTLYGIYGVPLYFVGMLLRWGLDLGLIAAFFVPLVAVVVITALIRVIAKTKRPDLSNALYKPWFSATSFPSAHASTAFAMAAALVAIHLDLAGSTWKLIPMLVLVVGLAMLIGYSRIAVGVHYKIDVIAGSLLGAVMGYLSAVLMLSL